MEKLEEFRKRYVYDVQKDHLGDGSSGNVFKAYDNVEDKYVAIKIVFYKNSELDKYSLENEVRIAISISDKTNIAVYDKCYRLLSDSGFLDVAIMQFYEKGNLKTYLNNLFLSTASKFQLITGIINGLAQIHHSKIIHRDLKPENILIVERPDGQLVPKIADFGISKMSENLANSRFSNSILGGTLAYSSPEQVRELTSSLQFNTDLWSLGVIIYEIFIGENPFRQGIDENLSKEQKKDVMLRRISAALIPDELKTIPQPYQDVIRQCIVVNPEKRIKSIDAIHQLIRSYQYDAIIEQCIQEFNDEEFAKAKILLDQVPEHKQNETLKKIGELLVQVNLAAYEALWSYLQSMPAFTRKNPKGKIDPRNALDLKKISESYPCKKEELGALQLPKARLKQQFNRLDLWTLEYEKSLTDEEETDYTTRKKRSRYFWPVNALGLLAVILVFYFLVAKEEKARQTEQVADLALSADSLQTPPGDSLIKDQQPALTDSVAYKREEEIRQKTQLLKSREASLSPAELVRGYEQLYKLIPMDSADKKRAVKKRLDYWTAENTKLKEKASRLDQYSVYNDNFSDKIIIVQNKTTGMFGAISKDGYEVIKAVYEVAMPVGNNNYRFKDSTGKWIVYNSEGKRQ